MAIIPSTKYPGKTAGTSPQYPLGKARNVAVPGDGTGTPWEEAIVNDWFGFQQSVLQAANITASGNSDEVGNCQIFLGLNAVVPTLADAVAADLSVGQKVIIKGRLASGDRGAAEYLVVAPQAADDKINHVMANANVLVLQYLDRILCTQAGIFPDGSTDWRANGYLDNFLQFLRDNPVTGVFIAGHYATALDNFYSDVKIHGEPGAIFGGVVHVAINDNIADDTSNRPQRVMWTGECASYERVGSYNCDDVHIERIVIREDVSKSISGFRGAGVHFYSGSRNMYVGDAYIEASERSYGLGVDFEPAHTQPENIHFGRVHIVKSYVHGVSLVGDNIVIDDLTVEEYGAGNIADPNINFGMPNTAASTTDASGFSMDNSGYVRVGKARINQKAGNPTGHKGALLYDGNMESDSFIVRDAIDTGFHNVSGVLTFNHLDVRLSGAKGIINQGSLTVNGAESSFNTNEGAEISSGSFQALVLNTNNNGLEGATFFGGATLNIGRLLASVNNTVVNDYQATFNAVKGFIGSIETSRAATGDGGGVSFAGDLDSLTVGNIITLNESDSVTAGGLAAVLLNVVNGLTISSFDLRGDSGLNAWQPLRLLTISDVNLNGGVIENAFNGNGVAAAGLTNIGFMNCNNKTGVTNIAAASVSEFNCVGMTV